MTAPLFGDFINVKQRIDAAALRNLTTAVPVIPDLVKFAVPDLVKVGPEGYIHGFICVRPPCGKAPDKLKTADLSVMKDGGVLHNPTGYAIGHVSVSNAGRHVATHADGHVTTHKDQLTAVKALVNHVNTGKTRLAASERVHVASPRDNAVAGSAVRPSNSSALVNDDAHAMAGALPRDLKLGDFLPQSDADRMRTLAKKGSASYEDADEVDQLKNTIMSKMLADHYGLSDLAVEGIAGSRGKKRFTQMSDTETLFQPMTWAASDWSRYGAKGWVSRDFTRGMQMSKSPEVRDSDFAYSDADRDLSAAGDGSHVVTTRTFTDHSPEAQQRRQDAMAYYGPRIQQAYTQMMLREAGIRQKPLIRYVFGEYGGKIANAAKAGEDWNANVNSISSWAQPRASGMGRLEDFITSQQYLAGNKGAVVKLTSNLPLDQVLMHWQLEGHLRTDGLREVVSGVPGGSMINSANTTAEVVS